MTRKMIKKINNFYVMIVDFNDSKVHKYDIIPYLKSRWEELPGDERPKNFNELREWINTKSQYMWWSRTEYEFLVSPWPKNDSSQKIDIYYQITMNIDLITNIFAEIVEDL